MPAKTQELISYFQNHGGIARFSAILKAGFHPDSLVALQRAGKVEKLGHGLYGLIGFSLASQPDLVTASLQAPKGIVCLISALAFHEATTEIPKNVDIAIPRGTHANKISYPPVKFYYFSRKAWEAGIEEHKIDKHEIRVYSLAKTVADCFKFRNRIGIDVAREALKTAVAEKHVKPQEIMHYAKICRVDSIVQPILEAIL